MTFVLRMAVREMRAAWQRRFSQVRFGSGIRSKYPEWFFAPSAMAASTSSAVR